MQRTIALTLLPSILLAGCAGEQALRTSASGSAGILNQYRAALTAFANRQNQANSANIERIERYQNGTEERRAEIASRRRAWRLAANERALDSLGAVSERTGEQILAMDATLVSRPRETPAAVSFDHAAVNGIIQQLVALQEPRRPVDRARDLIAFTSAVREAFDAEVKEAADVAADATGSANQQAVQAIRESDQVATDATPAAVKPPGQ